MNNDLSRWITGSEKLRVIRVFISSTFHDMMRERNHLITVVFPGLRDRVMGLGLDCLTTTKAATVNCSNCWRKN